MKKLFFFYFCLMTTALIGQESFNDCAAICLNKKAIVTDYSPRGICEMELDASGKLAVYTVELTETAITPKQYIGFKIAVRDVATKTIWLFSEETYQEIEVEKVLKQCKKGDTILLLTVDKAFALPHNEILVK